MPDWKKKGVHTLLTHTCQFSTHKIKLNMNNLMLAVHMYTHVTSSKENLCFTIISSDKG